MTVSRIPPAAANRPEGTSSDLSRFTSLASAPDHLVSQLDTLLLHGSMSPEMRNLVLLAVHAVPDAQPLLRVQQAVYLIASSSQYQVVR